MLRFLLDLPVPIGMTLAGQLPDVHVGDVREELRPPGHDAVGRPAAAQLPPPQLRGRRRAVREGVARNLAERRPPHDVTEE